VVECGTWKGGTAASLFHACRIVGRKLVICELFETFSPMDPLDREAQAYQTGDYCGSFDENCANITKYGDIRYFVFVKGCFRTHSRISTSKLSWLTSMWILKPV
jgi:hypothetical protein